MGFPTGADFVARRHLCVVVVEVRKHRYKFFTSVDLGATDNDICFAHLFLELLDCGDFIER